MNKMGFFDASGKVLLVVEGMEMEPPEGAEYSVTLGVDATANNVFLDPKSKEVRLKTVFPIKATYNKVTGLPAGTEVIIDGIAQTVNDGVLEFETNVEELVHVQLLHPHHLYERIQVQTGPAK